MPLFVTDFRAQLKEMADKIRAVTFKSVASNTISISTGFSISHDLCSTKTHRFIPLVFQHSLVVWCWKIPKWLVEGGCGVAIYNYSYSAPIIIRIQISIVLNVKGVKGLGNEGSVLCERAWCRKERIAGILKRMTCKEGCRGWAGKRISTFRHFTKNSRILILLIFESTRRTNARN
jgi:hypothetical protein